MHRVFALLLLVLELGVVVAGQTDSWDAFRLSRLPNGHCRFPMSVAFNHDGDIVAACNESRNLVKYVKHGKGNYTATNVVVMPPCEPRSAVFHLNSGDLAVTCDVHTNEDKSKTVVIYTRDTSGVYITNYLSFSTPRGPCGASVRSIVTNSAGDLLVGCSDFIMKFSFDNGAFNPAVVARCDTPPVAFTPAGDVVAGCVDTIAKFKKTADGYDRTVLSACQNPFFVAVNDAGDIVAACRGNDASHSIIKFTTTTSGTYTATYLSSISNGNCPSAQSVAINSAGDVVAACNNGIEHGSVVLYSYRQGMYYASALSDVPGGNCRFPWTVAFSPLGDVVAGCTGEGGTWLEHETESIVFYTIKDDTHTRTHSITSYHLDHDEL